MSPSRSFVHLGIAIALCLPACTTERDASPHRPQPNPSPSASEQKSPTEQLLATVGDVGSLTWRCATHRSKLVRFTSDPDSATNEVRISRGPAHSRKRYVDPGQDMTFEIVRGHSPLLKIAQSTEPRSIVVKIRFRFGHGPACLTYVPPVVHIDQHTRPH